MQNNEKSFIDLFRWLQVQRKCSYCWMFNYDIQLTLASGQINCPTIQASIRSGWNICDSINAKALISIFWTNITDKIIGRLKMIRWNSNEIHLSFVIDLHRSANQMQLVQQCQTNEQHRLIAISTGKYPLKIYKETNRRWCAVGIRLSRFRWPCCTLMCHHWWHSTMFLSFDVASIFEFDQVFRSLQRRCAFHTAHRRNYFSKCKSKRSIRNRRNQCQIDSFP